MFSSLRNPFLGLICGYWVKIKVKSEVKRSNLAENQEKNTYMWFKLKFICQPTQYTRGESYVSLFIICIKLPFVIFNIHVLVGEMTTADVSSVTLAVVHARKTCTVAAAPCATGSLALCSAATANHIQECLGSNWGF